MKKSSFGFIIVFVCLCCITTSLASSMATTTLRLDNRTAILSPLSLSQCPTGSSENLSILSPRCSAPVILESGDMFTIWLTADGYWGYRMIRVENGMIVSYNYKDPYYSISSYSLQAKSQTKQKVLVTNDLDMSVTVLLRLVLPDATYSINTGTILM